MEEIIFEPRHNYQHTPDTGRLYDCIVVGFGAVGYASAMYAARLGLKVLIIGEEQGGTLAGGGRIENYPGFISIEGADLTKLLENHALDYDVDMLTGVVDDIKKHMESFHVKVGGDIFKSRTLILATGAAVRKLGVPGEERFAGRGVGYCALCEAVFVKDKVVAVVGGGDSAVKESILVAEYAKKVFIINNAPEIHPEGYNMSALQKLIEDGKVEVINSNELAEVLGNRRVEGVVLKREYGGSTTLPVNAVFIYVGRVPRSALAENIGAALNKRKEILIDMHSETNIKGLFAAGDVTALEWKQAIVGVAQGVTAAYYAYQHCKR